MSDFLSVKFEDTFQFMASSLEKLASNLLKRSFNRVKQHFTVDYFPTVTKKGVYPYEYTHSWSKLNEIQLLFSVTDSYITDDEYNHAKSLGTL